MLHSLWSSAVPDEWPLLQQDYCRTRALTECLAAPLGPEDMGAQSMPDASPTKWHLAHTSWFFETVILSEHLPGYRVFDERFGYLFNSYYESLGPRHPRPRRGLLTRPSAAQVQEYRRHVDRAMGALFSCVDEPAARSALAPLIRLGIHHEQQHQELILTDVKHLLSCNPLLPAFVPGEPHPQSGATPLNWIEFDGGIVSIGHDGNGFAFDNEGPRHKVMLRPFRLASRPVTCGEYDAFIADGGYRRPEFWLSDGWAHVQAEGWAAPLYWSGDHEDWSVFTLMGNRPLRPAEPVAHVSFYEAAAYAAWAGRRLPTEFEWERAATRAAPGGNLFDPEWLHPRPAGSAPGLVQLFGDVWEWTRSSYDPYPGFRPWQGAVAEYNGKFMVGHMVLRGGSCVTPAGHIRATYRNFFPPSARWQFSGIRLAEDP